jgi:excisionase family DNA binding protein
VVVRAPGPPGFAALALLAVPRSSVYEYARRRHGRLPSIVVGRHRRFYRSDLEAWLTDVRDA